MVLVFAVGLVLTSEFIAGIGGGSGGDIGGESDKLPYIQFADMPKDISNYIEVDSLAVATAMAEDASLSSLGFQQSGGAYIVDTAAKFVYCLRGSEKSEVNNKTYRLTKDFIITSAQFINRQKTIEGSTVFDGNGHSVISNVLTEFLYSKQRSGGFISEMSGSATIKNLNYYYAPNSLTSIYFKRGDNNLINNPSYYPTVGGFIGYVYNGGKINNCNINIYGSVYALATGASNRDKGYPLVGGAFGYAGGTSTNCVFNIIGATISATSHDYTGNNGKKGIGGVAGELGGNNNIFNNCVLNVSPSTLIGADLFGHNSNNTNVVGNEVGVISGATSGSNDSNSKFNNVVLVNYNGLYDFRSIGPSTERYRVPTGFGWISTSNDNDAKIINLKGGSILGEDMVATAETRDNGIVTVTTQTPYSSYITSGGFVSTNIANITAGSTTNVEFYQGLSSGQYLVKDSYTWNRLVGLSGTRYFIDDGKYQGTAPFYQSESKITNSVVENVKFDTASNVDQNGRGRFELDSNAAVGYKLYSTFSGNNGDDPVKNVVVFNNGVTAGPIGIFSGTMRNLGIKVNTSIDNKTNIQWYNGGFMDVMRGNIENCVIDADVSYAKTSFTDPEGENMMTPNGITYYGGLFGNISGLVNKCDITVKPSIVLTDYRRYQNDNNADAGTQYATQVGGFAGATGGGMDALGATINNSIVRIENFSFEAPQLGSGCISGFIGDVSSLTVSGCNIDIKVSTVGEFLGTNDDSNITGFIGYHRGGYVNVTNANIEISMEGITSAPINVYYSYLMGGKDNAANSVTLTNVAIGTTGHGLGADDKTYLINRGQSVSNSNVWVYNMTNDAIKRQGGDTNGINYISTMGSTLSGESSNVYLPYVKAMTPSELADASLRSRNFGNFTFFINEAHRSSFYDGGVITRAKSAELTAISAGDIYTNRLGWMNGDMSFDNNQTSENYISSNEAEEAYVQYIESDDTFRYGVKVKGSGTTNKNIRAFMSTKYIGNVAQWNQVARNTNNNLTPAWMTIYIVKDIVPNEGENAGNFMPMGTAVYTMSGETEVETRYPFNATLVGYTTAYTLASNNGRGTLTPSQEKGVVDSYNSSYDKFTVKIGNISAEGKRKAGLFGVIGNSGRVKGLNIDGNRIDGISQSGKIYMGTVAGENFGGTIEDVKITVRDSATISLNTKNDLLFGLIAGENKGGTIKDVIVNVEGSPIVSFANIDRTALDTQSFFLGGAVGWNEGPLTNVAVNLNNLTFRKGNVSDAFTRYYVAGGIGYNNGAALNNFYVSSNRNNFDASIGANNKVGVSFVGQSTTSYGGVAYLYTPSNNASINIPALKRQGGGSVTDAYLKTIEIQAQLGAIEDSGRLQVNFVLDNGAVNTVVSSAVNDQYAIAGYYGNKREGNNITGGDGTLSGETSYTFPSLANNNTQNSDWKIRCIIMGNRISSASDWYYFQESVNNGSSFKDIVFYIDNDITLTNNISVGSSTAKLTPIGGSVKNADGSVTEYAFEGILDGSGNKITLSNVTFNTDRNDNPLKEAALFGILKGEIRNINIEVNGSFSATASGFSIGDGLTASAVLVADNRGTIDLGTYVDSSYNSVDNRLFFTGSAERNITANPYAGILTGVNKGRISGKIDANANLSNTRGVTLISSSPTAYSGVITGFNAESGVIDSVNAVVGFVHLDERTKSGVIAGENKGIVSNVVIDAYINLNVGTTSSVFKENIYYFFNTYDNADNINNVWIVNRNKNSIILTGERYSSVEGSSDVFNIMYLDNLNSTNDKNGVSVVARDGSVKFEAVRTDFYGYVENFTSATEVAGAANGQLSLEGNIKGKVYAVVHAKREVSSLRDLRAVGLLSRGIVRGLQFELVNDLVITEEDYAAWEPINNFVHILKGRDHTISTAGIKSVSAKPIFNTIDTSGGIQNVNIEVRANIEATEKYSALLVRENNGIISNVNVTYYGTIQAAQDNTEFEGVGVIAGINRVNGVITLSSVTLASNDAIFSSIVANYAGAVAGVNNGRIDRTYANVAANSNIEGKIAAGGIAGLNAEDGSGTIIGLNSSVDASVTVSGNIVAPKVGGVVGINNNIITNIIADVDNIATQDDNAIFAGIAAESNGYIGSSTINWSADSLRKNISKAAAVAVNASGIIYDVNANVYGIIGAKEIASGFIVNMDRSNINTADGALEKGYILSAMLNVDGSIVAGNDSMQGVAVGFVYDNNATNNSIIVNINGTIGGRNMTDTANITSKASAYGYKTSALARTNRAVTYVFDPESGALVKQSLELSGGGSSSEQGIESARIAVYLKNKPIADEAVGMYFEYPETLDIPRSWFIKTNSFSLKLGAQDNLPGVNEFRAVIDKELNISWENDDNDTVGNLTTTRLNISVNASAEAASYSRGFKEGELEYVNGKYTFRPDLKTLGQDTNRVVVFSNFKLDINNGDEFSEVNNAVNEFDLFYDININLYTDIVIGVEGQRVDDINTLAKENFVPFGNMYAFNSVFNGNGHSITIDKNINGANAGLFGIIGEHGVVNDIVVNVNANIGSIAAVSAGGFAGSVYGKVNNVFVKFRNDADSANIPKLNDIEDYNNLKNDKVGAFAGLVGEKAVFDNVWVIYQNDRMPAVNGKFANATDFLSLPNIGIINLGGVSNDLFVEYVDYEGGDKTLAFFVDTDVLPTRVAPWKNQYGGVITHTANSKYAESGYSGFNVEYPISDDATIYTVSLIKTYMTSLDDLINFANNVKGFNIDSMEQFYLDADINIDAASLLEAGVEGGVFQSIGSLSSMFKARFNAQGHTVTIGEDVTIKAGSGGNAGFFAYLASSAIIENLKLVVKTNNFDFWNYAGSIAGVNEGTIKNSVVEYRADKPINYPNRFGGIVGNNNTKGAVLNSEGVYLVTDYLADKSAIVAPSASETNSIFNTVYIHKPHDDRGIGVDYATAINGNKITISSAFGSDYNGTAPYFGLLDSQGTNLDPAKTETTELSSAAKRSVYSMVFLNTVINDADDLIRIAMRINSGVFNVSGLVFDFNADVELVGNHTVISDTIDNGFKATLNGNGHTLTFKEGSIYGEYSGFIGYMTEEGIIKNISFVFEDGFTVGSAGDDVNAATRYAGLIVGHSYGLIENVLVYDKGAKIVSNNTNVVVGTSSGTLINTVLVVDNAKEDAMSPISGVSVVKLIGRDLEFTDIRANENGSFKVTSDADIYVYDSSDMSSCSSIGTDLTLTTVPSFISGFDVIISNEAEYRKAVEEINSADINTAKRTLYNVTFSIDSDIDSLVVEGSETLEPIGKNESSPFVSAFNGHGKILRVASPIKGEGYAGIFGYIGEEGSISDLIIYSQGDISVSKRIVTDTSGVQTEIPETYIGAIAYNKGNINNSLITSANGSTMSDAMYAAGGIAVTEKMTNNLWYLTTTTGNRVASTTAVGKSGVNVLTMVGQITEQIVANVSASGIEFKRADENGVGKFFANYAQAGVNATGSDSIAIARGSVGLVYEYVNVKNSIESSDDWRQIAYDVNAGYPLANINFTLESDLEIAASQANMVTKELSAKIEGNSHSINIVGVDGNVAEKEFVLIASLGATSEIKNVTFNVGAQNAMVSFGYVLETKKARGIFVGENNGSINNINVNVNANVGDQSNRANMLSVFVGVNNGSIRNVSMTVNGVFHMRGTFGYLAVENNGSIGGNVNDQSVININSLAIIYGVGFVGSKSVGYAVGYASNNSVIEYLDINVGDGAALQADSNRTEVGGYVGSNSGIIRDGIITFGKIGSLGYYMKGDKVGFFAGVNESNIDNLVAKALNEPKAGELYIRTNNSNNRYDYNGGMTGSNNFLIVEDSNREFGENTSVRDSSIIVMENSGDVEVTRNADIQAGKRFKFTAKSISSEIGFNGWYENGELIEDGFEFVPAVASAGQKIIYNVVFLKTTIESVKEWNDFVQLVNGGRDVSTAVFSLREGLTLTFDVAVDPVGTLEHPFNGKFNGNGGKIVINGGINVNKYTGLFGYVQDSVIANIDVEFNAHSLGNIRDSVYSGILAAFADNTTIARGSFSEAGEFTENQAGLNRITNNGEIYASINAGGAIGYITNGYVANTVVDNYGGIRMSDSVQNEVGVGGIVGRANNSSLTRVTTNNKANGAIVGRTAGGIVGNVDGISSVTNVSVTSFEDKAIIRGDIYKGGVVGFADNSVTVKNLFIKFRNNGTETPAIGRIVKAWVQNNADITTGEDINAWIITDTAQSNMHRYNGRHVVRVESFNDIEYIENEEGNTAILRAVLTEERRGMFTFWHHTATGIVVDESNGGEGILNVDGISPDAGNFDITLEYRNTVEREDHLIALNNFSVRKSGSEWFETIPTIYVTNDISIDSDLSSVKAILDGNYGGVIHILAIHEGDKVFGGDATLKNLIVTARGTVGFENTKLENVILSEDDIYRSVEDIPDNDAISYMGASGSFEFTNVTIDSATKFVARTKSSVMSGISEDNTIRIIGNVPLKTDNAANIEGFHDFSEGLDNDQLFPYTYKVFGNTTYYYLAMTMVAINSEKTLDEMDFLLDNGFDFRDVIIMLNGDINIGERDSLGDGDSKYAVAFNGTLDGNGYKIVFGDNYSPLFTNVGDSGDIRNFIVYVNYQGQENSSVFQSNVNETMSGQQTNIIIINTNKDGNTYPGKTFKNIPNTLLIQQYQTTIPNVIGDYAQMSRLWIDMDVYGSNGDLNIGDILDIKVSRQGLGLDPYSGGTKGIVDMNVWSKLGSVGKIFTGFKYLNMDNTVGELKSNSALATDDLGTNERYILTFMTNEISNTETWNGIASINETISTVNGEILITSDITLDSGYSELTTVSGGNSATINGQGHTVKITTDDNALLNGYVGKIHDIIIDASETSLTAADIIANAKDKTEFERVVVLTSNETAEFDNSYTNVVLGKDPTGNTIAPDKTVIGADNTLSSISFAKGEYLVFILKEGKVTEDKYAEIAFDGAETNGVYTVEYLTEISSAKALGVLGKADDINYEFELTDDIVLESDVTFTSNNKLVGGDSATIDIKGYKFTINNDETVDKSATLKNIIVRGEGTLDIQGTSKVENVIVFGKLLMSDDSDCVNVWTAGEKAENAGVGYINLGEIEKLAGSGAYVATVTEDGNLSVTFGDALNEENRGYYLVGVSVASDVRYDNEAIVLTGSIGGDIVAEYISNVIGSEKNVRAEGSNYAAYVKAIAAINKSDLLEGKTFFMYGDIDFTAVTDVSEVLATRAFTLDGGDGYSVIKFEELNSTTAQIHENVTVQNLIIEFHHRSDEAEGNIFRGKIESGVTVITYEETFEIMGTAYDGTNTRIIKINHYDAHNNKYFHEGRTVMMNTERDFVAYRTEGEENIEVTTFNIDELPEGVTNINFYLPIKVTISGLSSDEKRTALMEGNDLRAVLTEDGLNGDIKINIGNVSGNVFLNGYVIDGNTMRTGYTDVISYSYDGGVKNTAINVTVNMVEFGVGQYIVKNQRSEFSFDGLGNDFDLMSGATSVVSSFVTPSGVSFVTNVEGVSEGRIDAGEYTVKGQFFAEDGVTVLGSLDYKHTIVPYSVSAKDISVLTREYARDANGKALTSASIDTDVSDIFAKLGAVYSEEEIESLKTVFNENVRLVYGNDGRVGNAIPVKATASGVIEKNFVVNGTLLLSGNIEKAKVSVTLSDREYTFDPLRQGYNIAGDLLVSEIINGVSGDGKGIVSGDIKKAVSRNSYLYIAGISGIIEVGEYDLTSNIASDNYAITVLGEPKVTVNKADYTVDISENAINKLSYLGTVKDPNGYFATSIKDSEGNAVTSMRVGVGSYPIIDEITTVYDGVRIVTSLGEYSITAENVYLTANGTRIGENNYNLTTNLGSIGVRNITINDGFRLISTSSEYNGALPTLTTSAVAIGINSYAQLRAEAFFLDEESAVNSGEHRVGVRIISDRIGEDVTEYVIANSRFTYDSEAGYGVFNNAYKVTKRTVGIVYNNTSMTYGDSIADIMSNMYAKKFDLALTLNFVGADGNVHTYGEYLDTGVYEIAYAVGDAANADIDKNNVIKTIKSGKLTVSPKSVDVVLIPNEKEITYGDTFTGFTASVRTLENEEWSLAKDTAFSFEYKFGRTTVNNDNVAEVFFTAGAHTVENITVTLDSNHRLNAVSAETLTVAPKKINVTFKNGSVSKEYTYDNKTTAKLDKLLASDELVGADKAESLGGIYTWKEAMGKQDVTLVGLTNGNYELAEAVVGEKKLNIGRLVYTVTVGDVRADEVKNTTTVNLVTSVGGKGDTIVLSLNGVYAEKEIDKLVNAYLEENNVLGNDLYDVVFEKDGKYKFVEHDRTLEYVVYAILLVAILIVLAMLISGISSIATMPAAGKRDFNFEVEKNAKANAALLKDIDKRKKKEYKSASKMMKAAAKNDVAFDIEKELFPEVSEEQVETNEEQE